MDRLTDTLNSSTKKPYHPAIAAAIKLARKKMNRYYSLTDDSNIYRIAIVLHPGLKLQYFRNQQWERDWIEEAERLVRQEYHAHYEKEPSSMEPTQPTKSLSFGNLSAAIPTHGSELEKYLATPAIEIEEDGALAWWTMNKNKFPNLHQMAFDYLSIPGLSSYPFI